VYQASFRRAGSGRWKSREISCTQGSERNDLDGVEVGSKRIRSRRLQTAAKSRGTNTASNPRSRQRKKEEEEGRGGSSTLRGKSSGVRSQATKHRADHMPVTSWRLTKLRVSRKTNNAAPYRLRQKWARATRNTTKRRVFGRNNPNGSRSLLLSVNLNPHPLNMAASVLGKRSRAVDEGDCNCPFFPSTQLTQHPELQLRTASKRRTRTPRVHQEEGEPRPKRQLRSRTKDVQPDQENGDENKGAVDTVPSKHTLRDGQGGSPTKINSHFRSSKPVEGKLRASVRCLESSRLTHGYIQRRTPNREEKSSSKHHRRRGSGMPCSTRPSRPGTECRWAQSP